MNIALTLPATCDETLRGVVLDGYGHPKVNGCPHPTGYCPLKKHRLRERRYTNRHHRALDRNLPLTSKWSAALVVLAQIVRVDEIADDKLRNAAEDGLTALSAEVRAQGLHKVAGIARYLGVARRKARARAELVERIRAAGEQATPDMHEIRMAGFFDGLNRLAQQGNIDAHLQWVPEQGEYVVVDAAEDLGWLPFW